MQIKSVFYNPYVDGSTNRLSISTMMKTAIILSKACADGSMAPFEDYSKYDDEATQRTIDDYFEGQSLPFVVKIIGKIAIFFAYNLGMVICTGLLMIEYAMAMIEFLLVGAISTLLIPFFFIDATKQFVSNLIRMIFNYFVKILVTTTMVFFVMGMYLNMAETMYTRILSDSTTVLYYVFVLVLGIILSKNSGKVASAVVSGNPSLGLGDIANQMRGMTHAMHSIEHTVEKTSRQMQAAAGAGKKMGNTLATAGAANDSILDGKEAASLHTSDKLKANRMEMLGGSNSYAGKLQAKADAGEQLSDSEMYDLTNAQQEAGARFGTDLSDKAIDNAAKQAGKDYEKQARSQFRNDWMYNKFTGLDRASNNPGAVRVGQTFMDEKGDIKQANVFDVAKRGQLAGGGYESQGMKNSNAALERYRNQKPDSDISAKELNERQQKKMPSWPEPEF